ncbi:MAG TPA: HAD-IC family P-type ATPase, partial [Anaerolineae bacterium]|nr:HAD-IC family P-type ATPase [Anaerolineae bacterium]
NPAALEAKLEQLGFPVLEGGEMGGPPAPWRNPKVLTSLASGVLLLAGLLVGVTSAPRFVSIALYAVSIVVGGYFFGREALEELVFEREIGIELLMSVAAVVAALMGQAAEGAMLVFLYSISEAAEGYTEEKTRAAIKALMRLAAQVALVRRNNHEEEVPVEELQVGDVFVVKPGQAVATDGVVAAGHSSVDQSPVTGESIPVEKGEGDVVFAGSINRQGALEVRATRTFADNTISRIIQMVEEAQERKGQSQRFIERFGDVHSHHARRHAGDCRPPGGAHQRGRVRRGTGQGQGGRHGQDWHADARRAGGDRCGGSQRSPHRRWGYGHGRARCAARPLDRRNQFFRKTWFLYDRRLPQ